MDAPSHVFNVIENIIPDLDQWNFRFKNSNSAQIFSWLKEEDRGDPGLFISWLKEENQPTVPCQQPIVRSSDFDVLNEFFPSVSPHSTSSNSSATSNSLERISPSALYPQNPAPPWPNPQFAFQPSYQPPPFQPQMVYCSPQLVTFPPEDTRIKGKDEECSNCGIKQSTMWRWNKHTEERQCNACNLYETTNNRKRPKELWKNTIMKRRRRIPKNSCSR